MHTHTHTYIKEHKHAGTGFNSRQMKMPHGDQGMCVVVALPLQSITALLLLMHASASVLDVFVALM